MAEQDEVASKVLRRAQVSKVAGPVSSSLGYFANNVCCR